MRDQARAKRQRGRAPKAGKTPTGPIPATPDAAAPRGTPAVATMALRRGARQRRSGVPAAAQDQELLPPELLQLVGGTLSIEELKAASLVCKLWSRSLRGGVTSATVHLQPDAASNKAKAAALAGALPHLASLHVHFGARGDNAALAPFFAGVKGMGRLRELRVTSWAPYAPQKGTAPLGCLAQLELGGVTDLALDGAPPNVVDMLGLLNGASSAPALSSLRIAPNTWPCFSQLGAFQVPAWLAPASASGVYTGTPRMNATTLATLLSCKLPGLARLEAMVDGPGQLETLSQLTQLSALSALDLLSGAPVQSKALQLLSSLTSLRELKLQPLLGFAPEALEEHSLLGLSQLRRLGVRLARRPAEPLCRDLYALTRRRAPAALVELELSKCVWSAEAGACVAALTALTRLRLERLECVRPARASASASRAAMSVDLQPLMALRGMRCFELVAATGSVAGVVQGLGRLWSAWAPTLEGVRLIDLSVAELDPLTTLPALGACGALTSLRLLLREPMAPECAVVDVGCLPARLEQLALRHVVVTADEEEAPARMRSLASISLRQCTAAPCALLPRAPLRAGALPNGPAGGRGTAALLRALPALRGVELVALPWLCDADFGAIGQLTGLTSLLVCASGVVEVSHASLQAISGLANLRQLRWHVGDVADLLPDVAAVRSLRSLVALHLPSYLHGQFSRWSAYNALPPLCDVHVEMPLP